ncbi:MAG: hypothetical protein ABW101_16280 [Candidatus Thiodiazotropha sp.]
MSEKKTFVLIYVNDAQRGPLIEGMRNGLQQRGAEVAEVTLTDDYQGLLDQLASGAVPLVIRQTM